MLLPLIWAKAVCYEAGTISFISFVQKYKMFNINSEKLNKITYLWYA